MSRFSTVPHSLTEGSAISPWAQTNVCLREERDTDLMRSTARASRVSSVKCQWNVKCLSRTRPVVCEQAGGCRSLWCRLDYMNWKKAPSTLPAPRQLSLKQSKLAELNSHEGSQTDTLAFSHTSWCSCELERQFYLMLCVFIGETGTIITNRQFLQSR